MCGPRTHLGALHPYPHATVTWSPWEGGTRQYKGIRLVWVNMYFRSDQLQLIWWKQSHHLITVQGWRLNWLHNSGIHLWHLFACLQPSLRTPQSPLDLNRKNNPKVKDFCYLTNSCSVLYFICLDQGYFGQNSRKKYLKNKLGPLWQKSLAFGYFSCLDREPITGSSVCQVMLRTNAK